MSKIAIVTGGGSGGYGAGIAEALQRDGAKVWITGRTEETLKATAEELGCKYIVADVSSAADWDRVFDTVLEEDGTVDFLIHNAGGGISKKHIDELSDEDIIQCINVNLTGVLLGSKRAAKVFKEKGTGTIVNISSVCAQQSWPGWSAYSAAKGGLDRMTKCIYQELRPFGARCTLVTPSWGQTKFQVAADVPLHSDEVYEVVTKPIELGNLVSYVCNLPDHLWIQDVTLWPTVQNVMPL